MTTTTAAPADGCSPRRRQGVHRETEGNRGKQGQGGLHPKIETRKLGTIFIEWEGAQIVGKEPCLYQGVQRGCGATHPQRRKRERLAPGVPDQTQRAVPLARCVPQGWGGGIAAVPRPAAGNPESASGDCQSGGGGCAAGSGVGTQDRTTGSGSRFFSKSLQACKRVTPEEHRDWRDSIYAERSEE